MGRNLKFSPNNLRTLTRGSLNKNNNSCLQEILSRGRKIRAKGMNQTEKAFSQLLEQARQEGVILKWHFEEITLKIAPNTRYIPDFVAVMPEGRWEIFEIKGHLEDDAAVKFKAAAEKFPEIGFHMLRKIRGTWQTIYHLPSRNADIYQTEKGEGKEKEIHKPTKAHSKSQTQKNKKPRESSNQSKNTGNQISNVIDRENKKILKLNLRKKPKSKTAQKT